MFKKSPRSETWSCLLGLLGGLIGFFVGRHSFLRYAEELRILDPDAFICGNSALPAMFGGLFLGGLIGALIGILVGRLSENRNK